MTSGGRANLSPRGRGVLAAAAVLLVLAKLFGSVELAGLSAAAGLAVGAGAVLASRAPMTIRAERWLAPAHVAAGEPASARLRFTNAGPAPTAAAQAVDPAGPVTGGCVVPPLAPGAMAEARYGLPTGERGVLSVGPMVLSTSDPFGLVERRIEAAGPSRLVVHPRIHPVLALPGSPTRETRHGRVSPTRSARGDDFFALREYEVGDDLRRVHWRSTARLGDLMLRQDELRFGEVATVLLDTRAPVHDADTFERSLEVAASIAAALVEDRRRLRFVTTGGLDVELDGGRACVAGVRGEGRWAAVLEHLAVLTPNVPVPASSGDRFALALQSIRRGPSGPVAAVLGDAGAAELAALGALRARVGLVMIARCTPSPAGEGATVPGATIVCADRAHDFAAGWNAAILACGRREAVRR